MFGLNRNEFSELFWFFAGIAKWLAIGLAIAILWVCVLSLQDRIDYQGDKIRRLQNQVAERDIDQKVFGSTLRSIKDSMDTAETNLSSVKKSLSELIEKSDTESYKK